MSTVVLCRYAAITQLTYRQVVGASALVWMPSKQSAWSADAADADADADAHADADADDGDHDPTCSFAGTS